MFKVTFCITLIILCWVKCNFSTPTETTAERESFFQRVRNKVKSFFQPVTNWVTKIVEEMLLPLKKFGGLTLRMELAAIAVNEHLAFPKQQLHQEDQIEHKDAKAIVILWQRLATMLKIDQILVNVTDTMIRSAVAQADNATKILFDRLEQKLKADPPLYAEYADVKSRIGDENLENTSAHGAVEKKIEIDESKAIEEFLRLPQIRKLIYNKRFILAFKKSSLTTSEEVEREFCTLVQAIITVAQKPEFSAKLQNLYDDALEEISKNYDPVEKLANGSIALFVNLEKRLNDDERLKSQINATETELIANGGCKSEASSFDSLLIL